MPRIARSSSFQREARKIPSFKCWQLFHISVTGFGLISTTHSFWSLFPGRLDSALTQTHHETLTPWCPKEDLVSFLNPYDTLKYLVMLTVVCHIALWILASCPLVDCKLLKHKICILLTLLPMGLPSAAKSFWKKHMLNKKKFCLPEK